MAAVQVAAGQDNTFSSFKRLMGLRSSDVPFDLHSQLLYAIGEGDRGEAHVYCANADGMLSPEDLSSRVIRYLTQLTEAHTNQAVTGAVVAVPAHFSPRQRAATLAAGRLAGLDPVHLLQEPVAAALAYGINGGTDGDTILVFDLGGGTFDVSVLQAFEGIMEVLGTAGDARLGGDDFDAIISEWIQSSFREHLGIDPDDLDKEWLVQTARVAKEALAEEDQVHIPSPIPIGITTEEGTSHHPGHIVLTNERFEKLTAQLFWRMARILETLGKEVQVEWAMSPAAAVVSQSVEDHEQSPKILKNDILLSTGNPRWVAPPRRITKVALVGHSTLLPSIRSFVKRLTGVTPSEGVDPGEAVALGSAIHAGVLLGSVGSVELMDGSFVAGLHSRVTGFSDWQP